jgi:secondary thiamine-phosphate synthase enzyme
MKIFTGRIELGTKGDPDLVDITDKVRSIVASSGLKAGQVTVFVIGSTAAVTTFEYEPGLIKDVKELYEKLVPKDREYEHDSTWQDANGYSHLRASLAGPSVTVPFEDGELVLGTWQQLVLAEFDNRPRKREVVVQVIGE